MIAKELEKNQNVRTIILGAFLSLIALGSFAATIEQETLMHLEQIRAIKAEGDGKTIENYNKQMDGMWEFFKANKESVLPILRRELSLELEKNAPNNLFLLDIGYFIRLQESQLDKKLGKQALFKVDVTSKIVRWSQEQLFRFVHHVAPEQDPEMLILIDKAFLQSEFSMFIPQHSLKLDKTLACAFLYGISGKMAEPHLQSLLIDKDLAPKVIEILVWIGSPDSVKEVQAAMMASRDYETFVRATAFMMKIGGPAGREAMLGINPEDFDIPSQEYYQKIRKGIELTSYETLMKQFSGFRGMATLSNDDLKKRLSAMYANYGKDDELSPEAIFNSGLSRQFLMNELTRIRERMFYRLSDEALSDVVMTNAILNTLHYKSE